MKSLLLVFSVVTLFAGVAFGADSEPLADEFVRPFPVVAIPVGASDGQKTAAREIADAIGVSAVIQVQTNAVCCVWIEVTGWTPNPGEPGYIIINQGGGTLISASNEKQLAAAVARFKASIRKVDTVIQVPVGLLTSYHIATGPPAKR